MEKVRVLGVVPARGGSKGLPGKNTKPLKNQPLLSYSVKASLASDYIDRTFCSTDDPQIAKVAESYGAEVPELRPAALAQDNSIDLDFLKHAINVFDALEFFSDIVVLLRPTSPFRIKQELDGAIARFIENEDLDSLRSVVKAPITPYKMWFKDAEKKMLRPLLPKPDGVPEPHDSPRQSLPEVYFQAGVFDIIRRETLFDLNSASGKNIGYYEVDQRLFVDIDTEEDFCRAEAIIEKHKKDVNFIR